MIDSSSLIKGQKLQIQLDQVNDRLPKAILKTISNNPVGTWNGGYKMVDGNGFGLVIDLYDGTQSWFFEQELAIYNE